MPDVSDLELEREPNPYVPPPTPRPPALLIIAVLALLVAASAWYFGGRDTSPAPASTAFSESAVPPDASRPLGGDPRSIDVPPLDESDPLVRRLVRELSSHPRVVAWLATDDLIRSFTVAVQNIADGRVPTMPLRTLRPTGPFTVTTAATQLRIDPRSYARFDSLAGAVDSIDPAGAAQLYATLKPRIEEAYAELGGTVPFDQTLERAIVNLLRAPAVDASVRLDQRGVAYAFQDPNVERLSAAQKQLVRMGPRNAATIQAKLRAIALALGVPADRLS
jgi:hypothetical protein